MAFKRVEVRKKNPGPGWWSDKTRMDLVISYVILGNLRLAAAQAGVPEVTVRRWKMQPWWKEAEDEIRRSSKLALSGRLNGLVAKSLEALEDRLANGDYLYDTQLHEFVRKPINAIAANKIVGDMIDHSLELEREASKDMVTEEGVQQRLDKIREEFKQMLSKRNIPNNGQIIDVSPLPSPALAGPSDNHDSDSQSGRHVDSDGTEWSYTASGSDSPESGDSGRDADHLEHDNQLSPSLYDGGETGIGQELLVQDSPDHAHQEPQSIDRPGL